ncbi:MAG: gamma-glutamylcyclotransferase [Candidatus Zixiibacteriota bacterium]
MTSRIGEYKNLGRGKLSCWRIAFNKRSKDGSAKANVVEELKSTVWGVLYDISATDIANLDAWEPGYSRIAVAIVLDSGEKFEAACYIAREVEEGLEPSRQYLDTILEGARENKLPAEYIALIEGFRAR